MKKPAPTLFWTLCFACLLFNNNTSTTSVSVRFDSVYLRIDFRNGFNVGYDCAGGVSIAHFLPKQSPKNFKQQKHTSPCSGTDYDLAGAWSWGGRLCVPVDRLPQPRLQASRIQHHNWIEIGACLASIKSLNENLGRNQVCALIRLQDAADTIFTNEFGCGFRCRLQIDLLRVDFELTDFRVHGVNQTLCHRLAREFNYTNNFIHTVRGLGNGSGQKQWQLWNRLQGCQDHHCLSCGFRGRLVVEIDLLRVAAKLKAEYRENREDNKIFEEPSSTEPGLEHVQNTALMVVAVSRPRQSTTALTPRRGGRNAAADANAISLRNVRDGVDLYVCHFLACSLFNSSSVGSLSAPPSMFQAQWSSYSRLGKIDPALTWSSFYSFYYNFARSTSCTDTPFLLQAAASRTSCSGCGYYEETEATLLESCEGYGCF
ncbi:hypothetical protein HDK90DRAFT_529497 [Phyllosticta capitalensis]|uniref:Uncharacterized protein n=1 Tax=Phyllosticta capitalensis TaxID=121624 RepID=A0ABR1Y9F7_9PEZI